MKKYLQIKSFQFTKSLLGLLLISAFFASKLNAQQIPQYYYETQIPNPEEIPFFDINVNQGAQYMSQWLYFNDDFPANIPSGRSINAIYFRVMKPDSPVDYMEFSVSLKQDSNITSLNRNSWETGLTQVRQEQRVTFNVAQDDWLKIDLDTVFAYDPNLPLIVEVSFKDARGGLMMYGGGTPLNSSNLRANTHTHGRFGDLRPSAERTNSYSFGFDFSPVEVDAEMIAIEEPLVVCSGTQNVSVTIGNAGTNQLDSLEIHWSVNDTAQGTVYYNQLLDTLGGNFPNTTTVTLGQYDFGGQNSELKVYVANPNGVADENTSNDTLVINLGPGLIAGTYTVDPTQPKSATNFVDLTSVADTLNEYGICGPVVFNVQAGIYNERLHLKNIKGASTINTITFDGGDSSHTIINADGNINTSYTALALEGTKHTIFKNIGFNSEGLNGGAVVVIANGTQYNTFSNCYFRMNPVRTTTAYRNIVFSSEVDSYMPQTEHISYNAFENNTIIGGNSGIYSIGHYMYIDRNKRNSFINNKLDSIYQYGMYINYQDSVEISKNQINVVNSTSLNSDALTLLNASNANVIGNELLGRRYAFYSSGSSQDLAAYINGPIELVNNMMYSERNSAVRILYVESINILHNSINTEGTGGTHDALYLSTTTNYPVSNYDIRNNIFNSNMGRAFYSNLPVNVFNHFDYNLFNTNHTDLIYFVNGVYSDLSSFQTAYSNFNTNSVHADPEFVSSTDLHVDGFNVFQKGDNSVGVSIDIDGDYRPLLGLDTVSIGADEFYPTVPCARPFDLGVSNVSYYSADVFWTDTSSAQGYEYKLVPCDSTFDSGIISGTSLDSLTLANLESNTCYNYYLRNVCSSTDSSFWVGPISFTTKEVPYYPIEIINTSDAQGVVDSIDIYAWTSGIVVGTNLDSNGYRFTLIDFDNTVQNGIQIYSSTTIANYNVEEGDSLLLKGTVKQNLGMAEMHIDTLLLESSNNDIPTALAVSTLSEQTESKLIELKDLILLDSAQTGTYNMFAYNNTDTVVIRIHELTEVGDSLINNLAAGDTLCSIIGIGGQSDASSTAPYLDGYYVMPMYYSDIVICKSTVGLRKNWIENQKVAFYPNPTSGEFTVESTDFKSDYIILKVYDVNGKVILNESTQNKDKTFIKRIQLEGQPRGMYFIDIIDGENRITKKLILK